MRKRAAGAPSLDGDHTFDDGYPTALIHYSGGNSTVSPLSLVFSTLSLSCYDPDFPIHKVEEWQKTSSVKTHVSIGS